MAKEKEAVKLISTDVPGAVLVIGNGFEKITPGEVIRFIRSVRAHRRFERQREVLEQKIEELKTRIIRLVSRISGLRGLQTIRDSLRTNVYQSVKEETIYDRELLRKSLREAYEGVVHEDLRLTILLTSDYNKEELLQVLRRFFGDEEAFERLVSQEVILRVDEEKLGGMISQEQVKLEEGARVLKKKETWNIKTVFVKK